MTITVHMQSAQPCMSSAGELATVVDCCFWKPCVRLFPLRPQPKLKKIINEHSILRCMFQALWFSLTNAGVVVGCFFFLVALSEQKLREIGGVNSFSSVICAFHRRGPLQTIVFPNKVNFTRLWWTLQSFLFQENCCVSVNAAPRYPCTALSKSIQISQPGSFPVIDSRCFIVWFF